MSNGRDLETLVSLVEIAAIGLTTVNKRTFMRDELLREVRVCASPEMVLHDIDLDLAMPGMRWLKRERGKQWSIR